MFEISSAPDKWQQIIRDVLTKCGEGDANIADDIIVYGRNVHEHTVYCISEYTPLARWVIQPQLTKY